MCVIVHVVVYSHSYCICMHINHMKTDIHKCKCLSMWVYNMLRIVYLYTCVFNTLLTPATDRLSPCLHCSMGSGFEASLKTGTKKTGWVSWQPFTEATAAQLATTDCATQHGTTRWSHVLDCTMLVKRTQLLDNHKSWLRCCHSEIFTCQKQLRWTWDHICTVPTDFLNILTHLQC